MRRILLQGAIWLSSFLMKATLIVLFIFISTASYGQYHFSGKINTELKEGKVYLSTIDDYRKISGVYAPAQPGITATIPNRILNPLHMKDI